MIIKLCIPLLYGIIDVYYVDFCCDIMYLIKIFIHSDNLHLNICCSVLAFVGELVYVLFYIHTICNACIHWPPNRLDPSITFLVF